MNLPRAALYLFEALQHARHACERTRQMLAVALAKLAALIAIERAASA
jgi:hypothetical protein